MNVCIFICKPQVKFRKDINQIVYSDFFWEKEQS